MCDGVSGGGREKDALSSSRHYVRGCEPGRIRKDMGAGKEEPDAPDRSGS